jgi:aminopeptidase N
LLQALPNLALKIASSPERRGLWFRFERAPVSPISLEKLPASTEFAEREQVINVLDFINRLFVRPSERENFQRYARSLLRPTFDTLGWEPKESEPPPAGTLRASLVSALGDLNDEQIVAGCRERFEKYLANPASLAPDLRPAVFAVVGRYADEKTWNRLHELGLKTTSIEEKQNYYNALAEATDPKLVEKTLPIALTDELPTSRAIFLVSKVAREATSGYRLGFAKSNK